MHIAKNLISVTLGIFICLCITGKSTGKQKKHHKKKSPSNFAFVNYNQFQQRELRIAYEGILVLETSIFQKTKYEMTLRQITDGRRIIQLIHQEEFLKDCESSGKGKSILKFVSQFMLPDDFMTTEDHGNVFKVYNMTNVDNNQHIDALQRFRKRHFLGPFLDMINIKHAKRMCNRLTRQRRRHAHKENPTEEKKHHITGNGIRVPNDIFHKAHNREVKNVQSGTSSAQDDRFSSRDIHGLIKDGLRHLEASASLDFHDEVWKDSIRDKSSASLLSLKKAGSVPVRPDSDRRLVRKKRSLISNFLIYPGTKWCGRGDVAMSEDDLGTDVEADVCCRDHDLCGEVILPFTTKYNYFNYRIHSLVSCQCDERFRSCLMQSVSPIANFLGNVYFNIMGTKCFKLKKGKVCVRRSWWGTCMEYENQQVAHLRNQHGF